MSRVLILHSLPKEDFADRSKRLRFCFRLGSDIKKVLDEPYVSGNKLICLYSEGSIQTFPEEMELAALGKLIAKGDFSLVHIETMRADETLMKILLYLPEDRVATVTNIFHVSSLGGG